MAHAYTPGLKVVSRIRHGARRVLPIAGEVRVELGTTVSARDVVAETFMPGNITPTNLANLLSLPPGDVAECVLKSKGDRIDEGEVLARTKGIFGLFKAEYRSKVSGTLESISSVTGQAMVRGQPQPIQVRAYLTGKVVEVLPNEGVVIEANVSLIQGIFGIGGETFGPIRMACLSHDQELTADLIKPQMQGAVIIGGARMTAEAVRRAIDVKAAAVVSGGMDDQDLRDLLGYDLGVAVTGNEHIGVTLVLTEGFGEIAMAERTFDLLRTREGDEASVNGATQIRAGVQRPEIVIPLSADELAREAEPSHSTSQLIPGSVVRIIRDPYFGLIGEVGELPPEPQALESGSKARVLEVRLPSAKSVTVPRANVELIEE